MAVTGQFLDAATYAAATLRAPARDFFAVGGLHDQSGGVVSTGDMAVSTGSGMQLNVAAGVAYVRGTTQARQGHYRVENDATASVTIGTAHASLPRWDLVVARVKDNTIDGGGANTFTIEVVAGTPNASPSEPALPASSYKLARIVVGAGVTSITAPNIIDQRTQGAMIRRGGFIAADIADGVITPQKLADRTRYTNYTPDQINAGTGAGLSSGWSAIATDITLALSDGGDRFIGIPWIVPADYASGTAQLQLLIFNIAAGGNLAYAVNTKINSAGTSGLGAGGNTSGTLTLAMANPSAWQWYTVGVTIPISGSLVANDMLRINVQFARGNAADTNSGTVYIGGARIAYTADS